MEGRSGPKDATHGEFDVFLAYNSRDEKALARVKAVWKIIEGRGRKKAWFAEKDTVAGKASPEDMANGIKKTNASALFDGEMGFGVWQKEFELQAAVIQAVENPEYRVFAVLLPGSAGPDGLPFEVKYPTVVDLRKDFRGDVLSEDGIVKMLAAVEGVSVREYGELRPLEAESEGGSGIAATGGHRALLVGVSVYDDPELSALHGPHNDIDALEQRLASAHMGESAGWSVTKCVDPSYDAFREALTGFFDDAAPEETLLFYYSGHGVIRNSAAHLCARDTQLKKLGFTAITSAALAEIISGSPAREKVIIHDCCHAAPIDGSQNPYAQLGEGVAVVLGSRGPADDAKRIEETSPFTTKLVSVLGDKAAFDQTGLTVSGLVRVLGRRGEKPWTNGKMGGDIVLVRAAPREPSQAEARPPAIAVEIQEASVPVDRLPLLRQLGAMLDSLLAVAREESEIPATVVRETIEMIGRELRAFALTPEQQGAVDVVVREAPRPPPTMAVRFADNETAARFSDLPWEYMPLCPGDAEGVQAAEDAMLAPPLALERVITGAGTKQSGRGSVQQVTLFSSLEPGTEPEYHVLTTATESKLKAFGVDTALAPPATWPVFQSDTSQADVVILQVPVAIEESGKPTLEFGGPSGGRKRVSADSVRDALALRRDLTWLFIESLAEKSGDQSVRAVRLLSEFFAIKLERPVVGVCHSGAYARSLSDNPHATPFLAHLLREFTESPLETAAHAARERVINQLAVDTAVVGVPVVIRPEPRGQAEAASKPLTRRP